METKVLTVEEFTELVYGNGGQPKRIYDNLKEDIHYFDWNDFRTWCAPKEYTKTLRFIVCLDNNQTILGIAKIAVYESSKDQVSCSYLSVNKRFRNLGVSKLLIDAMLNYIKNAEIYRNKPYGSSEYSISGWMYIRNYIIKKCNEIGLKFIDNVIGFDDRQLYDEFYYTMIKKSREEYNSLYKDKEYWVYN